MGVGVITMAAPTEQKSLFYKPPVWAAAPNTLRLRGGNRQPPQKNDKDKDDPSTTTAPEWKLLQVKEGVVVATHNLSHQACTVLGRAVDQVDIVLQHESCSRQHARIAFDGQTGTPWLLDLHSTHGTTVNRRPLPAAARHAEIYTTDDKTGSRGVILYPFDVLQFGASTRKFCLEGPADYERGTNTTKQKSVTLRQTDRQTLEKDNDPKRLSKTEQPQDRENKKDDSVLWGMDRMDDDELFDDSHPPFDWHSWLESIMSSRQKEEEILNHCKKEWDTIRVQWQKLQQAKLEHSRIQRKSGSGLSQGQEEQLQRLQQRQTQLQASLEQKAQKLYQTLHPSAKSHSSYHDYVDDEEVEDRTNRHRSRRNLASSTQPEHKDEAETEGSLVVKYSELQTQLQQLQSRIQRWQRESAALQQKQQQQTSESKNDDEEAFFVQNQVHLVQQELDRARTQVQDTNQQLEETLKLLLIVAPQRHAQLLREQQQQQQQPRQTNVESSSNDSFSSHARPPPPLRVDERNNNQLDSDGFVVPSAIPRPTTMRAPSTTTTTAATVADQTLVLPPPAAAAGTATSITTLPLPPPKKQRIQLGPQAPPPPPRQDTRKGPHTGGTLDFVQAAFQTSTVEGSAAAPKSSRESSSLNTQDPRPQSNTMIFLQENDDTWRPPKDQDGSGYTKLNEKFAGRY